jgi:hypothetical protein
LATQHLSLTRIIHYGGVFQGEKSVQANKPIELFCSYAPEDTCWLNDLETHLRSSTRQGLFTVWHEQRIAAGENKSQAMHIHLATADVILLLISSSFFTSENCYSKVMPYALERHQKQEALVIPILLRAVDWQQAPFGHLKVLPTNGKPLALWEDKDAALTHVATHLRRLIEQRSLHGDADLEEISPYKGLLPYTEADAAFFFDHEVYLQQLLAELQVEHRFLLILGPSCSGKTSLVQAGLIPLLRRHGLPGLTCTDFVSYIPHKPLMETWLALPIFNSATTAAAGLTRWRQGHPHPARIVLIIDALEELFHCADKQERDNFVAQLEKIIHDDLATLLLIMRDDYYSDLATYETLIHTLERHLNNIPHLTVEMTRTIIEKPAQQVGLKIEASLVNTIADDTMSTQAEPRRKRLRRHSSVLPLLSYTLTQLFQRREDFELTWQGYHDLGGIAGSLPAWATNAYLALSPAQQHLARHIFTALVVPGDEDIGVPDHRQETFLAALVRDEQELPAIQEVVEQFTRAHLLESQYDPSRQDVRVTLISETLLHEWSFLQDWLREDRAYLSWYRPFLERVKQWHNLCTHASEERAAEVLLHEGELFTAQDWYKRYGSRWTPLSNGFSLPARTRLNTKKNSKEHTIRLSKNNINSLREPWRCKRSFYKKNILNALN